MLSKSAGEFNQARRARPPQADKLGVLRQLQISPGGNNPILGTRRRSCKAKQRVDRQV
jgi:hypothetical protein